MQVEESQTMDRTDANFCLDLLFTFTTDTPLIEKPLIRNKGPRQTNVIVPECSFNNEVFKHYLISFDPAAPSLEPTAVDQSTIIILLQLHITCFSFMLRNFVTYSIKS